MNATKRSKTRSLPCVFEDINRLSYPSGSVISSLYATESVGRYKIVVIGDKGCGKTSLLNCFVNKTFEFDVPLIFEESVSTVRSGTKHVDFVMWDLSGCIEYDGLRYELYKDTDIFLICFDIGDLTTLQNVTENWIPELALNEPTSPFLLVGCKNDLRNSFSPKHSHIRNGGDMKCSVDRDLALRVVREWGGKGYVECCARTGFNVSEVFRVAAQIFISSYEAEKNNLKPLKGFSKFAKRKSAEFGEMFQPHSGKNNVASRRGSYV